MEGRNCTNRQDKKGSEGKVRESEGKVTKLPRWPVRGEKIIMENIRLSEWRNGCA